MSILTVDLSDFFKYETSAARKHIKAPWWFSWQIRRRSVYQTANPIELRDLTVIDRDYGEIPSRLIKTNDAT